MPGSIYFPRTAWSVKSLQEHEPLLSLILLHQWMAKRPADEMLGSKSEVGVFCRKENCFPLVIKKSAL